MYFKETAIYLAAVSNQAPGIALVTGGRSGIGLALAKRLASLDFIEQVLCVSRSISENDLNDNDKLEPLQADITTSEGRDRITKEVQKLCQGSSGETRKKQLRFLIDSAGSIDPIKPVMKLQPDELRKSLLLNCEAPLFLTTALHPYLKPISSESVSGRVLHVSSGVAHGAPPVGWSAYGISKAAFYQSYKVLEREFRGTGVVVGSFKPGVVDTSMQQVVRGAIQEDMPIVQYFVSMKEKADQRPNQPASEACPPPQNALDTPFNVAFFAEYLLLGTPDEEFADAQNTNEHDIRDSSHYSCWIPSKNL